jgi:hypothetical protein
MSLFISSFPGRAIAFIAIGAAAGVIINMVYLLVTGRTAAGRQAS